MPQSVSIGSRWFSQRGSTAVIVVRAPGDPVSLECAGLPMLAEAGAADPASESGTDVQLGKRYADVERGLEVLVTAAGPGPLALDGDLLTIREPKRLPASD